MITAQEIREKVFETSRIGGYDRASVDDFLEELAEDAASAQKENASLKAKMKVLVDKIEEYRANEEALNLAILSAQKLAVQIESEARARAAAMLEDADRQVKARVGSIEEQVQTQEQKLAEAKAAADKFLETARSLCQAQLKKLDAIDQERFARKEAPAPVQAPAQDNVDDAVRSIEDTVARLQPEPAFRLDLDEEPESSTTGMESTQPFTI